MSKKNEDKPNLPARFLKALVSWLAVSGAASASLNNINQNKTSHTGVLQALGNSTVPENKSHTTVLQALRNSDVPKGNCVEISQEDFSTIEKQKSCISDPLRDQPKGTKIPDGYLTEPVRKAFEECITEKTKNPECGNTVTLACGDDSDNGSGRKLLAGGGGFSVSSAGARPSSFSSTVGRNSGFNSASSKVSTSSRAAIAGIQNAARAQAQNAARAQAQNAARAQAQNSARVQAQKSARKTGGMNEISRNNLFYGMLIYAGFYPEGNTPFPYIPDKEYYKNESALQTVIQSSPDLSKCNTVSSKADAVQTDRHAVVSCLARITEF